jgi:beta-glucosidase
MQSTQAIPEAGIPSLELCDGPYGLRFMRGDVTSWTQPPEPATCFPPGVAVGCSWDPEVASAVGTGIAVEARAYGVGVSLGPAMNIKRSPLCGRNFEYYSEDPLLTGVLASAHVSAAQAGGVGTCPKHFAANNQETDRMTVSADVDERTLREIYLAGFEHVVSKARPAAIMAAYNRVNGVPASANPWLLTTVLREQWGFEGVVISDWGAVADRVASLRAGLDLEMPGGGADADEELVAAVRSGELDEAIVEASAPPPACPRRNPSRIASTSSCQPSRLSTPPWLSTTTVRGAAAATALISSTCSVGRSMPVRSVPSDSAESGSPANTTATSA